MNLSLLKSHYTTKLILDDFDPAIIISVQYEKEVNHVKIEITMTNCVLMKFKACSNGDLLQLLRKAIKHKRHLRMTTKLYLVWKLFEACNHLWCTNGLSHNDLKLSNILIDTSDCLTKLVLCDFGHTTSVNALLRRKVGTPEYRAPEINQLQVGETFSAASAEVHAFGSVIFTILF